MIARRWRSPPDMPGWWFVLSAILTALGIFFGMVPVVVFALIPWVRFLSGLRPWVCP